MLKKQKRDDPSFLKRFSQLAGIDIAQSAIDFVVNHRLNDTFQLSDSLRLRSEN